eukprot:7747514-Pyramimonas_sp.AAC.1
MAQISSSGPGQQKIRRDVVEGSTPSQHDCFIQVWHMFAFLGPRSRPAGSGSAQRGPLNQGLCRLQKRGFRFLAAPPERHTASRKAAA